MKALLNRVNGICQFVIGVVFLLLMFKVSLAAFAVAIVLAALAYAPYRLLLTLPLGSTIVFAIQAGIAWAVGEPLLATIGFVYVPFSLVVDVVNFMGLFTKPQYEPLPYAASDSPYRKEPSRKPRITTVVGKGILP